MTWMAKNAGGFPLYLDRASGARVIDLDGHELIDFCLGDTGAMAGHSPAPTVAAVQRRFAELGGATTMMPTEDAGVVAAELTRRFGAAAVELRAHRHRRQPLGAAPVPRRDRPAPHPRQQLLLPRQRRRVARHRGRRRRRCHAGSRPGNVGAPCDVTITSRVAEFNDLDGAGARAGPRRRGRRPDGAGAHEHGHRAARARLPRRRAGRDPRRRRAADQRRDAHDLGRSGRVHAGVGVRAGHRDRRQGHRRRHPGRRVRAVGERGRAARAVAPTSTWSTPAGSAARWPATRCRWPRHGPRSSEVLTDDAFDRHDRPGHALHRRRPDA